jgi:hypothetical protein
VFSLIGTYALTTFSNDLADIETYNVPLTASISSSYRSTTYANLLFEFVVDIICEVTSLTPVDLTDYTPTEVDYIVGDPNVLLTQAWS